MDKLDYLACLESDYRRLREVAPGAPTAPVPSCPGWTMTDLVTHVAQVYVDKTETMRTGKEQDWPPKLGDGTPVVELDRAYAALVAELTARDPGSPSVSWYKPDQTAGFWVRRMAHETVIHRVDAELAAGVEVAPIRTDLALDGIDEVLTVFLSFATYEYPDYVGEPLTGCDGRAVSVEAGEARWTVRLDPGGVDVTTGGETAARVSGSPRDLLLWLWGRAKDDAVRRDGDAELVTRLRRLLAAATV